MDPTVLFTHLKFILLQYFQFSAVSKRISSLPSQDISNGYYYPLTYYTKICAGRLHYHFAYEICANLNSSSF